MNFVEFAGAYPWALTILKSELLLRMVESLEKERSAEELAGLLAPLTREDIERALRVLVSLGVVEQSGEKYVLSDLGKRFLDVYRRTF